MNGVKDVPKPEVLFNDITELNISGEGPDFLSQVRRYESERTEENIICQISKKNYQFDFLFDKALKERSAALKDVGFSESDEDENKEENQEENDHLDT